MVSNVNDGNGSSITIQELLRQIDDRRQTLSAHHPTRLLLEQCKVAIVYLAQRVPDAAVAHALVELPRALVELP